MLYFLVVLGLIGLLVCYYLEQDGNCDEAQG